MNILAIDLGSSNIKVAIVSFDGANIRLINVSTAKTYGIKSGKITSINDASDSIKKAISNVKENISLNIDKIVVSVSGAYTNSLTGYADIRLDANGSAITIKDIEKAINVAKTSADIPIDQIPIHVLPYRFRANNTDNIEDPLGMMASSFKLEANIITMSKNDFENIKQILINADIKNYTLVSSIYANAIYCLNADEKDSGVAIVDCGAQVCDIAIYAYNSLIWMYCFSFGSANITNDIAKYLTTSNETADKIKMQFSLCQNNGSTHVEYYKTGSQVQDRVSVETIAKCVDVRLTEILECIYASIYDSQNEKLISAMILTGGCSKMENLAERASPKFNNKAVRTIIEKNPAFVGENEIFTMHEYTCLLGLCMYASGFHTKYELDSSGILLNKVRNSDYNSDISFSLNSEKTKTINQDYYLNMNKEKQHAENIEKTDKDDILESIKMPIEDEKKEGSFSKAWKNFCTFIERIF